MNPTSSVRIRIFLFVLAGTTNLLPGVQALCPSPPRIDNGFIQMDRNYGENSDHDMEQPGGSQEYDALPTNFVFNSGDTILNSCYKGYRLAWGSRRRVCTDSKRWTGTQPQCVSTGGSQPPVECRPPRHPSNGHISPSGQRTWREGDSFRVRCEPGYEEPSPNTFVCRSDGTWSSGSPACPRQQVNCEPPRHPSNGFIYPSERRVWREGDSFRVTCESGYEAPSPNTFVCLSDGTWSSGSPVCSRPQKSCPPPRHPSHGYISPSGQRFWREGDSFLVTCDSGYDEPSPNTFACRSDGTWSSGPPVCSRTTCDRPTVLNGYMADAAQGEWGVGASFSIRCYVGYEEPSPNRFECMPSGSWLPSRAECERKPRVTCSNPAPLNGYINTAYQDKWYAGDSFSLKCFKGYEVPSRNRFECTPSGRWSPPQAACTEQRSGCPSPPGIENGHLSYDRNRGQYQGVSFIYAAMQMPQRPATRWNAHDAVLYECSSGYSLFGSRRRVCTKEGTWTGTRARCVHGSDGNLRAAVDDAASENVPRCTPNPCLNECHCEETARGYHCNNVGEVRYLGKRCEYDPPEIACDHDKIGISLKSELVEGMDEGRGNGVFYLAQESAPAGNSSSAYSGCRFSPSSVDRSRFLVTVPSPFANCGTQLDIKQDGSFSFSNLVWFTRDVGSNSNLAADLSTTVAEVSCIYKGFYQVSATIDAICCATPPLITSRGMFSFQTSLWKDPPGPNGSNTLPGGRLREQIRGTGGAVTYTVGQMLFLTVEMSGTTEVLNPKLRTCWMSQNISSKAAVQGKDLILHPGGDASGVSTWGPVTTPQAVHFGFQLHQTRRSSKLYLHCQIQVVSGRERRSLSDDDDSSRGVSVLTKGPIYVTKAPGMSRSYGVRDFPYEVFMAICIFGSICILLLVACCYAHLRMLHSRNTEGCTRLPSVSTIS